MKQKVKMFDTVIRVGIAYNFYIILYSFPTIKKLNKKLIAPQNTIYGLPKCTTNVITQLPHDYYLVLESSP